MVNRIRGKVRKDWNKKGIILILGDDKKEYFGHWDFEKKGKIHRGSPVYFFHGEPETLADGTIAKYPTALDVKRPTELLSAEPEQTAKVAINHQEHNGCCENCGCKLFNVFDVPDKYWRYCPQCGAKLEWK